MAGESVWARTDWNGGVTTIVFAAGGTGGHLYPAVALAQEFIRRDPAARVLFVGTARGLETKVLAHEGFELAMIAARPVMGQGVFRAAGALLSLPQAVGQSLALLRQRRASFVLGVGGYTSPPVLIAACLLGLPRALLEPNAFPGVANRVMGPIVDLAFVAFRDAAGVFPRNKVRVAGIPVRRAFLEKVSGPSPSAAGLQARRTLLVFGGSQGARAINEAMVAAMPRWAALQDRMTIVHQTGEADHAWVAAAYERVGVRAEVMPFLFDMPGVLHAADLVVSRAGAMTLAELTACGKPAILIPLPHAIHQHQLHNARVLAEAGAAVLLLQQDLSGERLAQEVTALLEDPTRLRAMSERSRGLGRPEAAETIVEECLALMERKAGRARP